MISKQDVTNKISSMDESQDGSASDNIIDINADNNFCSVVPKKSLHCLIYFDDIIQS